MADRTATRIVTVNNPQGIHARPADMLVRMASRFQASIEIVKDGERVDGKSVLNVLTLAAEQGTRLELVAMGDDAEEALAALCDLIEHNFEEDETTGREQAE